MREITFRGKRAEWWGRSEEQQWVMGSLYFDGLNAYIIPRTSLSNTRIEKVDSDGFCERLMIADVCGVDSSTVCQYTGLTDIKGNKVFEKDIVELEIGYVGGTFRTFVCSVAFSNYNYGIIFYDLNNKNHALVLGEDVGENDIEVIGNIFDNSELLEGAIV